MSSITVKQIELAGAGVIRSDLIKKSIIGKIYEATIYYGNSSTNVRILYYKNGNTRLLGPAETSEKSIQEFESLLMKLIPKMPHPDFKNLRIIRAGIAIAASYTIYNIATITPDIGSYLAVALDIATTGFILFLYSTEGKRYVKEKK